MPLPDACAAAEPSWKRILRWGGLALLIACGAALAVVTCPILEFITALTFLRLALFVSTLGVLASSVAAFWWREAALQRVEWAAYLGIALLLAEQFAIGRHGIQVHPAAVVFGLLVLSVVLARVCRRRESDTCNCG